MSKILSGPTDLERAEEPDDISIRIQAFIIASLGITSLNPDVVTNFHTIVDSLNKEAKTDDDQVALIRITEAMDELVIRRGGLPPQDLEAFQKVQLSTYRHMLLIQGSENGNVIPVRMDHITRREVAAGRMSADDDLRNLAIASFLVMGEPMAPTNRVTWPRLGWGQIPTMWRSIISFFSRSRNRSN